METREAIRLEVEELPELDTSVALCGSSRRQEVGGALCLAIAAGIAIFVAG